VEGGTLITNKNFKEDSNRRGWGPSSPNFQHLEGFFLHSGHFDIIGVSYPGKAGDVIQDFFQRTCQTIWCGDKVWQQNKLFVAILVDAKQIETVVNDTLTSLQAP
jgi:hypothetical protein